MANDVQMLVTGAESTNSLVSDCVVVNGIGLTYATSGGPGPYGNDKNMLRINSGSVGSWSLSTHNGTTGVRANMTLATAYYSFRFALGAMPTGQEEIARCVSSTATLKMALRINTDGTLALYDSTNTLIATGTTTLTTNTWYRIDLKCSNGASTTGYALRINETMEIDGTVVGAKDLAATNNSRFLFGKTANVNSTLINAYFAQIWLDGGDYAPNGYQIDALLPTADGSTNEWTGGTGSSNYAEIGEQVADATSYVKDPNDASAPVTGLFGTLRISNASGISGTINASSIVATRTFVEASDDTTTAVSNTFQFGLRSGSTDGLTSTRNTGTSSSKDELGIIHATDPATSAAWTSSGINSAVIKIVENTNSVSTRVYYAVVFVGYVPSKTGFFALMR